MIVCLSHISRRFDLTPLLAAWPFVHLRYTNHRRRCNNRPPTRSSYADAGGAGGIVDDALSRAPWSIDDTDGNVVSALCDLHTVLREVEDRAGLGSKRERGMDQDQQRQQQQWVAPASFERVTTKYWVRDEDLHGVLLASVSALPLLVYGRKGKSARVCTYQ